MAVGLWLALACAGSPARADASCAGANAKPKPGNVGKVREAVYCLIDQERAERGLPALRRDARLAEAATEHSRDMVAKGYFDHEQPDGDDLAQRARQAKYLTGLLGTWALAENIACGGGREGAPSRIVRQWMASPGHRANVLSPVMTDVGVGVVEGLPTDGRRGVTYTLDLGLAG